MGGIWFDDAIIIVIVNITVIRIAIDYFSILFVFEVFLFC
jgi:hypothetical protein